MKDRAARSRAWNILVLLGALAGVQAGLAQGPPPAPAAEANTAEPTPTDALPGLEAFVDGAVEALLTKHKALPGVTVSVVKDGEIALLKGYGLADVDTGTPVDPSRSLFRIGSITKTFTGLAVWQMVDRGLLDLDADVNTYLRDFQIPEAFGEPITLRHLINHRSGFEDGLAGHLFVRSPEEVMPMGEYLVRHMRKRVRPPGQSSTYTNYGLTLAGYIVEVVSGQDFASYLDEHIFGPLDMRHSTIRDPLGRGDALSMRPELEALIANGHAVGAGGKATTRPQDLLTQVAPAGAIWSTAEDMAKYMIARIDDDRTADGRLLSEEATAEMSRRAFDDRPLLMDIVNGMGEGTLDGYRFRWHNGGSSYFFSDMSLFPEIGLGIFVSTNSSDGGSAVSATLPRLIFEHYFPSKLTFSAPDPPADFATRGQKYAGTYLVTRRSYTKLEKLLALPQPYTVAVSDDGYLLVTANGQTQRYVEVGAGVFQNADPGDDGRGRVNHLYVYEDDDGVPVRLSVSTTDPIRIGFLGSPSYFFLALGMATIFAMTALLGAWRRARRGLDQTRAGRWASRLWILGALAALLAACGLAATVAMVAGGDLDPIIFDWPPPPLYVALLAGLAVVVLVVPMLLLLPKAWREPGWSLWRRLHYSAFVLSLMMLVIAFHQWNMLGFRY